MPPNIGKAVALPQDSAKGGAVETGCSGLHYIIAVLLYDTTPIRCTPLRQHPPVMNTHCPFAGTGRPRWRQGEEELRFARLVSNLLICLPCLTLSSANNDSSNNDNK